MTAFITHYWRKSRLDLAGWLICALLAMAASRPVLAESPIEVSPLRLERSSSALLLSTALNFELPSAVGDALLKGVAVFFVAEAEIYRERWYWVDKRVAGVQRHMRLAFHPLTRRWRLAVSSAVINPNGLGVALSQSFDTLEDALAAVQRISSWQIAELVDLAPGATHRLDFRFRLDVSQLPRPLQIGTLGQSDWALSTSLSQRLEPESSK